EGPLTELVGSHCRGPVTGESGREARTVQQRPGDDADQDTAGDLNGRNRQRKEVEDISADQRRTDEQQEAVERDSLRCSLLLLWGKLGRDRKIDRRRAERVHDRQQRSDCEQDGRGEVAEVTEDGKQWCRSPATTGTQSRGSKPTHPSATCGIRLSFR